MHYPIDTAPKDRRILLFARGEWHVGKWNDDKFNRKPRPFWDYSLIWRATGCREQPPIAWAELPEKIPGKENLPDTY